MWRLAARATSSFVLTPLRGGRVRLRETLQQAVKAGNGSLPLVGLICFLVGMIMALQSAYQLSSFGAVELVADLVAVSISRELAPFAHRDHRGRPFRLGDRGRVGDDASRKRDRCSRGHGYRPDIVPGGTSPGRPDDHPARA